ncbi:unnamed protein product [Sphagnum balticum]
MKLSKLVDPQFQAVLRKLAAQEIPLRTAFKLKGIIKTGNDELAKYDEVRGDALKRFGDKKEDGSLDIGANGTVQLSSDNKEQFVAELNALLASDINLGNVKLSELGDKVSLTTEELLNLEDLIVE